MKNKTLYSLLGISLVLFTAAYLASQQKKPVFRDHLSKNIPTVQAASFDYSQVSDSKQKKQVFFSLLRPIIENENQRIRDDRQHILFIKQYNTDPVWLNTLAQKYKIEWNNDNPQWDELLQKVDTIPVELVMSQAANESAWGQSRFAQQANNLFGQWCFKKGCGLVPKQRDEGSNHEVKKFSSINTSIASYMHNINTGRAYQQLRKLRADIRSTGKPLNAIELATGLEKYSSRGHEYVKEIQSMIKTNLPYMQGIK